METKRDIVRIIAVLIVALSVVLGGFFVWRLYSDIRRDMQEVPETGWETLPADEMARVKAENEARRIAAVRQKKDAALQKLYEEKQAQWDAAHTEPYLGAVRIESCLISGDEVIVRASGDKIVLSEDSEYHLIAQDMYTEGIAGTELASAPSGAGYERFIEGLADTCAEELEFRFPLNKNTASSNLFKRFFVAVNSGGSQIQVSAPHYITNPEACADRAVPRDDEGKKGILPAAVTIRSGNLRDLGVDQAIYNLRLGDLCSGGGISYTYNGRTYSFSSATVGQYDIVVPRLSEQGIQITMVLLNNAGGGSSMLHPLSRTGARANYYAFNTAEQAGVERLAAAASFLAERYSGNGRGTVDNWIIGNEINARADWHYMSAVDLNTFTAEYVKAFRLFYNVIRSKNANARLYIPIDQQWAQTLDASKYYSSRDFLDTLNRIMTEEGNIDWHVAMHPYNYPLTDPYAWTVKPQVTHSYDTAYIAMQNIDVLTDYLSREEFLTPDNEIRSVLCSEVGYTSSKGQAVQAAAVVYGYLQAEANVHIDGFLLSREMDDPGEVSQGLSNGLLTTGGGRKTAYNYYKYIDGPDAETYKEAAASIIGVDNIMSLITVR